jgi:hypothetical protein
MTKIKTEMLNAVDAYSGPVKRCRPGKARGPEMPRREDRAQRWLNAHHRDVPLRDEKAERRKKRMARAERDRIAKRNAFVQKRNGLSASPDGPQPRSDRENGTIK